MALLFQLPLRFLKTVSCRALWHFTVGAGLGNLMAFARFQRRKRKGRLFPPIVFASVTQRCNLQCRGCWATGVQDPVDMSPELLQKIVDDSAKKSVRFFGVLGGEPLLLPWLPAFFKKNRKAYFQLFTNGRFLDQSVADALRVAGNVSPLISVEGVGASYAARRGDDAMYDAALQAIEACRRAKLVTGVAVSVSASNMADVVQPGFIDEMVVRGAHYVWYYIYRPSGPNPGFEEALSDAQVRQLRQFLVDQRKRVTQAVIIDAYWDAEGHARCPAAVGINVHVSAGGAVEVCPPVQCADARMTAAGDFVTTVEQSTFIRAFQAQVPNWTTGCVLMDHPDALAQLAMACQAQDSSGRHTFFRELSERTVCGCHNHSGSPIPESSWFYRCMKRTLFFGFGSYA